MEFGSLSEAIGKFEGFGLPGTPATRNNNPGNIIWGDFARDAGAIGSDERGFAVFPDVQTGFEATDSLIEKMAAQGKTIKEMLLRWAPPTAPGNDATSTNNYIDFASNRVGATPDTQLNTLREGGYKYPEWLVGILGKMGGMVIDKQNETNQIANTAGFFTSPSRIAAALVGLICIAGAIFLLQPSGVGYLAGAGIARLKG